MNSVKDVARGTANCDVLQEGRDVSDHAHVTKATPLDTKRKEIQGDLQYQTDAIDPAREKSTSAKRMNKDTRPL
jgi:hypothetical protein